MTPPALFTATVIDNQLTVLMNMARLDLTRGQLVQLGEAIRDAAARVQARAVRNVSGYPAMYDGKVFRVVVRTGALKGAIDMQWPYQNVLQARVFVNGAHTAAPFQLGDGLVTPRPVSEYAAAIEYGHGEIDLKKTMMGKTVPFFASRGAKSTGPFAARGLSEVSGTGGALWENGALNTKLLAAGKGPMHFRRQRTKAAYVDGKKGGGSYYIAFRKVGKTGWIIPAAAPRPFMRAALRSSAEDARLIVGRQYRGMLASANPNP